MMNSQDFEKLNKDTYEKQLLKCDPKTVALLEKYNQLDNNFNLKSFEEHINAKTRHEHINAQTQFRKQVKKINSDPKYTVEQKILFKKIVDTYYTCEFDYNGSDFPNTIKCIDKNEVFLDAGETQWIHQNSMSHIEVHQNCNVSLAGFFNYSWNDFAKFDDLFALGEMCAELGFYVYCVKFVMLPNGTSKYNVYQMNGQNNAGINKNDCDHYHIYINTHDHDMLQIKYLA